MRCQILHGLGLILPILLSAQTAHLDLGDYNLSLTLPVDTLWRLVKMPARDLGIIDSLPPPALAVQLPNDNINQIRYHFDEFSLIPGQIIDLADAGAYSMEVNGANDSLSVDPDTPYPGGTAGLTYFNNPGDANSGFQLVLNLPGTVLLTAYDTLQLAAYASEMSDLRNFRPLAVGNIWLFTYMGNTAASHIWEKVVSRVDTMMSGISAQKFTIHQRTLTRPEYGGDVTESNYQLILKSNDRGAIFNPDGSAAQVFTGNYLMWPQFSWHSAFTSSGYYTSPAFSLIGADQAGSGQTWAFGIGKVAESLDGAGFLYLTGYVVNGDSVGDPDFPVGINPEPGFPGSFALKCYPNPFNPTTTIRYAITANNLVTVTIYDQLGRTAKILVNTEQTAGDYQLQWNGTDQAGRQLSSGLYFCRIRAGNHFQTIKIELMK